jgi:SAM-dependent methyltransferase
MNVEKVDYDNIYSNSSDEHFIWVKKVCLWKAEILSRLSKDIPMQSILEIGTGRGDVLGALSGFEKKIGADISEEALKQHKTVYPKHELIKIDADNKLPLGDNQIDCVLLCDILEHVDKPAELLKEAARVGKYVLLKIPVENALFFRFMNKVRGVKYGLNHPSGHLHCWNMQNINTLLYQANITIIKDLFLPTPIEQIKYKFGVKILVFKLCGLLDKVCKTNIFNRLLLGGSYFAIGQKSL